MAIVKGNKADWGKFSKGLSETLIDAGFTVTKYGAQQLGIACQETLEGLDWMWPRGADNGPYRSGYRGGNEDYPWYTGNLHDSVAAGVADGVRLLTVRYMKPGAKESVTYEGQEIYGKDLAPEAFARAVRTFRPGLGGLRAILTIGVPYADEVNRSDAHYDFQSELADYFLGEVRRVIADLPLKTIKMK